MCTKCAILANTNAIVVQELVLADCGQAWEYVNMSWRAITRQRYQRLKQEAEAAAQAAEYAATEACLGPDYADKLKEAVTDGPFRTARTIQDGHSGGNPTRTIPKPTARKLVPYKRTETVQWFRIDTLEDWEAFNHQWIAPWDDEWPDGASFSTHRVLNKDAFEARWNNPFFEMFGTELEMRVEISGLVVSQLKLELGNHW